VLKGYVMATRSRGVLAGESYHFLSFKLFPLSRVPKDEFSPYILSQKMPSTTASKSLYSPFSAQNVGRIY